MFTITGLVEAQAIVLVPIFNLTCNKSMSVPKLNSI
jgi:hypothetical protein